jgi:hypothetical protein
MKNYPRGMGETMNIRYGITRQLIGTRSGANAAAAWMIIAAALCLGSGTASAVTLPAPATTDAGSLAASREALLSSSGLADAPSFEVALLGDNLGEENAMFDAAGDAANAGAPASADSLSDVTAESARGFESSGNGRGLSGYLIAAGATAAIVAEESSHHTAGGFKFGAPGASNSTGTPSSTPTIGSDETPGNDPPVDTPEPGTFALLAAGIAISAAFRRRLARA